MKSIRYVLWGVVALAAAGVAFLALDRIAPDDGIKLGAPFELQSTTGETVTNEDFLGKPHLIFFGFTHCPEICPTTLYETTGWMDALGKDAEKLNAYFITVDPERDTQEVLSNYMSPFGERIIGLTGSLEEMDKAAKGYHVYYKKVPLDDGDYTMDHTASVFLMKADGSFQGMIAFGEDGDIALEKIRRLLKG
jgi:protein SCO1/2